ncbi:MAG: hypothetical protein R2712_31505 [Vicinamibacterales bacterium]
MALCAKAAGDQIPAPTIAAQNISASLVLLDMRSTLQVQTSEAPSGAAAQKSNVCAGGKATGRQ